MAENKKMVRNAASVVRYLLGLIFLVFGLNGFFSFIPMDPPSGDLGSFMGGLAASGYFFPLLKGTEVLAGLLLLSGLYVPLAIAVLGPITLNIFLTHAAMEPNGMAMAVFVLIGNLFLAFAYRENFKSLFQKN